MSAPIKLPPEMRQYFECRMMELRNIILDSPFDQLEERFVNKLKSIFEDGGAFLKKGIKDNYDEQVAKYGCWNVEASDLYAAIEDMTVNSIIEKTIKKGG